TAELIKRIGLHKVKTSFGLHIPRKSGITDITEWQKFVLQCFPHIGPKIAQRILEYFGSIYAFCNATVHDLSRIEGLSEQKAAEIYQIIHSFYKDYVKDKLTRLNENQKNILDYVSTNENRNQ
ncbi:MAG: helix-hairpin-helix domain-containing protein, partial [Ignisphaera sp.]